MENTSSSTVSFSLEDLDMMCEHEKNRLREEIRTRFSSHILDEQGAANLAEVRSSCFALAQTLVELVPSGQELQVALQSLETVMFQANAGISRQFPVKE